MAGTAGKYHINANGDIEKCTATVRPCPYGATGHYDTPGEAKVAMEKMWKEKILGKDNASTLSKKNNKGDDGAKARKRGGRSKKTNNGKTNTEKKRQAEKYLVDRDEVIRHLVHWQRLTWRDRSVSLAKSINVADSETSSIEKPHLSSIDKYQMKAADQLGNKSDLSRGNPESPWMPPRNESTEVKKERDVINQQLGYQHGNGELHYTSAPSEAIYNSVIGGSKSADSIYSAKEGLTEPVFDDEIGIDSTIGIAPAQSLNYRVHENDSYYNVAFTVTDDDLIRAGVDKKSLSNGGITDLTDPVLYKNARYMQAFAGNMNRKTAELNDSRGEDDNGKETVVYLDSKPMFQSITRLNVPGVDTPSWVFSFRGKAAIDPDEDPDYLYD